MQSEVVGFEFVKSQNSSFKFNENEISKTRSAQAESQPRYEVADVLNILGSKLENLAINSWQLRWVLKIAFFTFDLKKSQKPFHDLLKSAQIYYYF